MNKGSNLKGLASVYLMWSGECKGGAVNGGIPL